MEPKFCQCCGMPMEGQAWGTEKNGTLSADYCGYCYRDGAFTFNGSLEEMIELCVPHMEGMEAGEARKLMKEFLPRLKRWKAE